MADVTSGDLVVIVLSPEESEALTKVLLEHYVDDTLSDHLVGLYMSL